LDEIVAAIFEESEENAKYEVIRIRLAKLLPPEFSSAA